MYVCVYDQLQDEFCEYVFAEAVKSDNKTLLENKPKFLLVCYLIPHMIAYYTCM